MPAVSRVRSPAGRVLLVVDNVPLQHAAWRELCAARQRLANATRDLHRHEEVDEPGFRAWLGTAFPELVTALRELTQQVAAKARMVEAVEGESWITGRSPRAIWRRWQRDAAEPAAPDELPPTGDTARDREGSGADDPFADDGNPRDDGPDRRAFEALFEDFCELHGLDPSDPALKAMREAGAREAGFNFPREDLNPDIDDARAIYRRLVHHLHPDRGGEWTPRRERVWHDVQAAWAAGDVDMLARLEAEWDMTADMLGPTSAVGRLRAALAELVAARRDAERKVRHYRRSPAWRFSRKPPTVGVIARLRREFEEQRRLLRDELAHFDAIIARWERPARGSRQRRCAKGKEGSFEFPFDSGAW